jgi:hypothetical protein
LLNALAMNQRRLSVVVLALTLTHPGIAAACGGLFCDTPSNPFAPPVAQTAENVLFAMEPGPNGQQQLEAHVQIFYTGPADRFSWVVPVDSAPTLDVGTDRLFQVLTSATNPRFNVDWQVDGTCKESPGSGGGGAFATPGAAPGSGGSTGSADAAAGVDVSFQGAVGPYDAAVVSSTDPAALLKWLADNKYFVSPEAAKLINDYVGEGKHFVAIRLQSGRDVNEIQPLVMRFLGPGPCVPIRLTSVAALNDLRINLWVLAAHRVVPTNYYEITIDPARIDWLGGGANYDELVKQAANDAGGNAFVTDFAGPPPLLKGGIAVRAPDLQQLAAARTPADAVNLTVSQGIAPDPALLAILRQLIPEPPSLARAGITESRFYAQISNFWGSDPTQFAPFDAATFAQLIDERIIKPRQNAEGLVARFPQLTRLGTFLSPEEMVVDPLFDANLTLPPVPVQRTVKGRVACGNRQYSYCEAPASLQLPDGQTLKLMTACQSTAGAKDGLEQAPALERGWARATQGDGRLAFDRRPEITAALQKHNAAVDARFGPFPPGSGGDEGCSVGRGGWDLALALAVALALAARRRRH